MYYHVKELQVTSKPEKPGAFFAMKMQEILGGQFGEMTVMMHTCGRAGPAGCPASTRT